jgi:leucyl-tRNA---protein transferase
MDMFAQAHCPETLAPDELDKYLARGWFRMGQTIFTTNFLNFKDRFYGAVWLRVVLDGFQVDKTQQKLMKRNASFSVEFKKAAITPEKELLYAKYKQSISFEASASLESLLFGKSLSSIYNTQEVNIYDSGRLIAAGFFDIGQNSAAGIVSFYDPAYKKFSLGKYLIYLKMSYCKALALQYFYPGYFVPGYSFFDYKLTIGRPTLEYLQLNTGQWLPIDSFRVEHSPLQIMLAKLYALQQLLSQLKAESEVFLYEYFDANLVPELRDAELFDFPVLLYVFDSGNGDQDQMIVYDVRDKRYHLIKCFHVWTSNATNNRPEFYSSHLLKID